MLSLLLAYVNLYVRANRMSQNPMTEDDRKLDQAARAAWMYYLRGDTQEEIARALGVSRQTAQRLVAQAMSAGLVKVRIDHPIAACLDLGARLREAFGLRGAEVVPDQAGRPGVARALADRIEAELMPPRPQVIALGTGRMLRAAVAQLSRIDCPQHRIVSLTGNIAPDGSAAAYNVLFSLSELVTARAFPLMVPVIAASAEERDALHRQPGNARVMALAGAADVAFVGLGSFGPDAPLMQDGYLTPAQVEDLRTRGAVGEVLGHPYDIEGAAVAHDLTIASAPLPDPARARIWAGAYGADKRLPALGALRAGRINGLVTDETTARWLLDPDGQAG